MAKVSTVKEIMTVQYKTNGVLMMKTIELPAYIGDIVNVNIYGLKDDLIKARITKITINRQGIHFKAWEEPYTDDECCSFTLDDFGKTVFTIEEEQ